MDVNRKREEKKKSTEDKCDREKDGRRQVEKKDMKDSQIRGGGRPRPGERFQNAFKETSFSSFPETRKGEFLWNMS